MSENHDADNGDYDREDLEHVENLLYANIHYYTGCNENQSTASNNDNSDDNTAIGTDGGNSLAARRNSKRYWSTNTSNYKGASKFVPFFKEKQSGFYKSPNVTSKDLNESASDAVKNDEHIDATANAMLKQFTPYVSFLPFNNSSENAEEKQTQTPTATASKSADFNPNVLNTNNDLIRNDLIRMNLTVKHINPFSKKQTIAEYKNLFSEDATIESEAGKTLLNKKRLNPFNALSRKAKKKKSEIYQNKSVRKSREELKRMATNPDVIDLDDADKDDDDVIILPTPKAPLICIDSSEDEGNNASNVEEHAFTEPNAVCDNRRKVPRCSSPSSSIQSADDFIAQNDQRTFGFDTFATLSDEDLCNVSETVENELNDKTSQSPSSNRAAIPNDNDNAIFTPPKQMQKDRIKSKESYEVGHNSFTAVDVYESESSDMPDSIYAKGTLNKRKKISDSDSSSVESVTITKSKRLRKRKKSSSSAKESDRKLSDDSSSDLPEVDDGTDIDDDDDDVVSNENSYLVRGEALGKVKNTNKKKSTKTNKNTNEKRSEDDFINKLSSIVRGQDESEHDEMDNTQETPTETIEARDIVETVLQRRTKKSKKNQIVDAEAEPEPELEPEPNTPENEKTNPWEVTDQIGETDDLNLGQIFSEINDESQPILNEANQGNAQLDSTPQQQPILESNESNGTITEVETIPNEDENDDYIFDPESHWNEEMKRFYNDSWGGETFSMNNIRARMPRDHLNWMITNKDKFPSSSYSRGRQYRCLNCQEKGHLAKNCPRPPAKKVCYMCGAEGHNEPKCPNAICLTCGNGTQRYSRECQNCIRERSITCFGCRQKGHREIFCPDRWRRYHSTTTLNKPLIEVPTLPGNQSRKYCCLCANAGHFVDECNNAHALRRRMGGRTPLSVRINSYRPILHAPAHKDQKTGPMYTILASNLNEYTFNFGNDVSTTSNTIYGRFRRAVKLNDNLNQSTTSENDVLFVNEMNLNNNAESPIEIDDDDDFEDGLEDVSASEHLSESAQNDSSMIIDDTQHEPTPNDHTKNAASKNNKTAINAVAASSKADVEIQKLDDKIHTLEELKEKILSHKSNIEEDDVTCEDSDQDTSIETNPNIPEQKDDVTTSSILPDFIPLTNDKPNKYEPTRSPTPVSADSTTNPNEKSDATIHLTQHHCKHLLSDKGHQFLRDGEIQFNVSVRLEWRQYGNVLIVNGIASAQQGFHNILKQFFESLENAKKSSTVSQLPKNRQTLITFVRNQLALLDSPICNVNKQSDVQMILHRIRATEKNPSKSNLKKMNSLRRHLNMILYGRFGLDEGKFHLNELQNCLRIIMQETTAQVSTEMRQKMSEHIDYIFSSNERKNYADIIDQYNQLKRDKALPPLNLDRKLLGLKINVYPNATDGPNSTSMQTYPYTNSPNHYNKRMESSTSTNSNGQNNETNRPSLMHDIQINVSSPSTSFNNNPNESIHRNNSFLSNRVRTQDKWKY